MDRNGLIGLSLLAGLGLALAPAPTEAAQTPGFRQDLCRQQTNLREASDAIPRYLLTAISVVESGRWDAARQEKTAWPWTINAGGKGRFFPTKAAAVAETRRLLDAGINSIDVGCMQVNLRYHPGAFANLDEAFDPARNVSYAAQFLGALKRNTNSWQQAAAYYHSSKPERYLSYQQKVLRQWRDIRVRSGGASQFAALDPGRGIVRPGAAVDELLGLASLAPAANTRSLVPAAPRAVTRQALKRELNPKIDRLRMAKLNQTFKSRSAEKRAGDFAEKRKRSLVDWRKSRFDPKLRNQIAAFRQAARDRRLKVISKRPGRQFAEKRRAQIAAWRNRRAPAIVTRINRRRGVY